MDSKGNLYDQFHFKWKLKRNQNIFQMENFMIKIIMRFKKIMVAKYFRLYYIVININFELFKNHFLNYLKNIIIIFKLIKLS